MENILNSIPLVDILNTGLAGFCFLVALMGYFLLRAEQKKSYHKNNMLKSIESFSKRSLMFGLLVAICLVSIAYISNNNSISHGDADEMKSFLASLPKQVRSAKPSATRVKIENELEKLVQIPGLKKQVATLLNENTVLKTKLTKHEAEAKKIEHNFLVKIARINRELNEFGGASINPYYPFNERKREVNMQIQDLLAELNHYFAEIDGDKTKTRDALVKYQQMKGFNQVGFFSFPTIKAMVAEYLQKSN
jgi:hypothetical protein